MKRLFILILFCNLLAITNDALAQDKSTLPSSTILFFRRGLPAELRVIVSFPNQKNILLNHGTRTDFKIYSSGEILITIYILYDGPAETKTYTKQVVLNVQHSNQYYVAMTNAFKYTFEEVPESEVADQLAKTKTVLRVEENLDFPINRESLKPVDIKESAGQATCFLISSEGYFITNYHCIKDATQITISGIGGDFTTKFGAVVIASDPSSDLALLKVNNKSVTFTNPPFAIRSSGVLQAEKVYALGFPHVEAMGTEIKVTEGIISAKSGPQGDVGKYQISAAVNPGNSGGPLVDEKGNLIGVIYAKSTIAESSGYAIKASYLELFLKNVDGFNYPTFVNTIENKSLPEKVSELKNYVFILETK